MKTHRHLTRAATGAAILLSLVACGGGAIGGSGYAPSSAGVAPALQRGAGLPDVKRRVHHVKSSCGKHIHIVVAGIVDCRFKEKGYSGSFAIQNHASGIVLISPTSGNKKTTFTVTGLLVGSGYFLVKPKKGREAKVTVAVTL